MSSSNNAKAGGPLRTKSNPDNKRPSKKAQASRNSTICLIAGHELDLGQVFVTAPAKKTDTLYFSWVNYGGKPFKLVLENVRLVTGIKEFEKPEGGVKRTFSVGMGDNGDGPQVLDLARILEKGKENHPALEGMFDGMEWEFKSPVWGDDGTALTLSWTDKTQLVAGEGGEEDFIGGARVRIGCSVSAWFTPNYETNTVTCGLTFKAESAKILQKKDASEVDWSKAL